MLRAVTLCFQDLTGRLPLRESKKGEGSSKEAGACSRFPREGLDNHDSSTVAIPEVGARVMTGLGCVRYCLLLVPRKPTGVTLRTVCPSISD